MGNIKQDLRIEKTLQGYRISYTNEYLNEIIVHSYIGYTKNQAVNEFIKKLPIIASNGYVGIKDIENYFGYYVLTNLDNRWKKLRYSVKNDCDYFTHNGVRYYLNDFIKTYL